MVAMNQWIYTLVHLPLESFSANRDAQIRFLKEENAWITSSASVWAMPITSRRRSLVTTANVGRTKGSVIGH